MHSTESITLMVGQLCPQRFAILGAVLIDKEIAESTNHVKLSVRLKGSSID